MSVLQYSNERSPGASGEEVGIEPFPVKNLDEAFMSWMNTIMRKDSE